MNRAERVGSPVGISASRRQHRLLRGRPFNNWLCADVGLQVGPPGNTRRFAEVEPLLHLDFDGVVLSQAGVERFGDTLASRPDLPFAVRLDWSGQWRTLLPIDDAPGAAVSRVEDAAASGADAVIQYAILGNEDPALEADFIARAARAVHSAHALGLACILEPLIRGSRTVGRQRAPELQVWAVRTAAELGADAVKIEAPLDPEIVLQESDVPVFISSTPPFGDDEAFLRAQTARDAGAAGTAYAADIFGSPDPQGLVTRLSTLR